MSERKVRRPREKPTGNLFGQNLQSLRNDRQRTQRELAFSSGINHSLISRVEDGQVIPNLQTAWRIARALRLSPEERFAFYEAGSGFEDQLSSASIKPEPKDEIVLIDATVTRIE